MAYQVLTADNRMVIEDKTAGLSVLVYEKKAVAIAGNTAYCLATLYRISGGFIPEKVFVFQARNETKLETLKKVVDFFFSTILETELYVKEVPPDSALYAEEAVRLYGLNEEQMNDGTVSVVFTGRAE